MQLLKLIGFTESGGKMVLNRASKQDLEEWTRLIKLYLNDKVIVVNSN